MHGLESAAAPTAFSPEKPTWGLIEPESSLRGPAGHSQTTWGTVGKHQVGSWPGQQSNKNRTTQHIPHSSCPTSHFPQPLPFTWWVQDHMVNQIVPGWKSSELWPLLSQTKLKGFPWGFQPRTLFTSILKSILLSRKIHCYLFCSELFFLDKLIVPHLLSGLYVQNGSNAPTTKGALLRSHPPLKSKAQRLSNKMK